MQECDLTIPELAARIALTLAKISLLPDGGNIEIHCKGRGYIIKTADKVHSGRIVVTE